MGHLIMRVFLIFLFSFLANMAVAQKPTALIYKCAMTGNLKQGDWIPDQYVFSLERDGTVQVADQIAFGFTGAAVKAAAERKKDELIMTWAVTLPRKDFVNGLDIRIKEPKLHYKAALNVKDNSLTVSAESRFERLRGHSETFRGIGQCTAYKL
ncbi:hypothetical protein G0Q03_17800 [Epibacterium mobile]|nr:hypothetical protein [Tritonibacter mobilis]